jgi:multimeric flavodoxin WrbA
MTHYFGNMAGEVKTFFDNWLLKFDFFREFKMDEARWAPCKIGTSAG